MKKFKMDSKIRINLRISSKQLFDGPGAIVFATSPSEPDDIGLLERQQAFLRALLAQGIGTPAMRSVRSTVREMAPSLETNLSLSDLLEKYRVLSRKEIEIQTDKSRMRPVDIPILTGSNDRIIADTGWKPEIPIDQTLADSLKYWHNKLVEEI